MNTRIHEEASEWLVNLRAGDLDSPARDAFDRWIRKSPEHIRAYLEMAAIWEEGARLDRHRRYEADELIERARDPYANVVPLKLDGREAPAEPGTTFDAGTRASFFARARRPLALVACVAALAVVTAFVWLLRADGATTYVTRTGEQHTVILRDGSTLELNARSRVRFRMTAAERRAELLEGQALFRVAHDARRPFIVGSNGAEVRAVGTQFDVKRRDTRTVVTVIEGRVAVSKPMARASRGASQPATIAPPVMLSAGDQVTVGPRETSHPIRVDVTAATAWTEGLLVFDEAPISEVVEEFNRYNARRLVVEDIGITRMSGAFSSTDYRSLVRYFQQRPDVVVTETDSEIRVKRK